jgi:hypothetical protein
MIAYVEGDLAPIPVLFTANKSCLTLLYGRNPSWSLIVESRDRVIYHVKEYLRGEKRIKFQLGAKPR